MTKGSRRGKFALHWASDASDTGLSRLRVLRVLRRPYGKGARRHKAAADNAVPNQEPAERIWTAAEAAEDLFAQLEDALAAGLADDDVIAALAAEGVEAATARWLIDDARVDAASGGEQASWIAGESGAGPTDAAGLTAPAYTMNLWQLRRTLRGGDDPMSLPEANAKALADALAQIGARASTAGAVVDELRRTERLMHDGFRARWRRLGIQGMIVGGAATALMLLGGSAGGAARWHWFTAALTAALFVYSVALWRRGQPPTRDS